jgi:hypothetical protein
MKSDTDHFKDSFNYHLSSCRIFIECAFGELVMRWGIFWRTLLFDLRKCAKIIQCSMLLHNYIIDSREAYERAEDSSYFQQFAISMDAIQQQRLILQTGEIPRAIVVDNNEPRVAGRRSREENDSRLRGVKIRHRLTVKLASHNLRRPLQHDMQYNDYGHVYMTS